MADWQAADPVRVVIVDDEALGRSKLLRYLEEVPGFEWVGEAGDGLSAVELIEEVRPDVVLLDIQMPELDGFDVLDALEFEPLPRIVFVTAHDNHAVRAFQVQALDYLLKPVDRRRFEEAMERAREAVLSGRRAAELEASVHNAAGEEAGRETAPPSTPVRRAAADVAREVAPSRGPLTRFLVRSRGRMQLIPVSEVDWIGAAGNYAELHVGADTHLVRGTMAGLGARLPKEGFVRIHRSTIVNLDRIESLDPWSHGDLEVVLLDGTRLRLSRRYRGALEAMFGP